MSSFALSSFIRQYERLEGGERETYMIVRSSILELNLHLTPGHSTRLEL